MDCESLSPASFLDRFCLIIQQSKFELTLRNLFEKKIGPLWENLLSDSKGPWTVEFMLSLIVNHWNAVFAFELPRIAKSLASTCMEKLQALKTASQNNSGLQAYDILLANCRRLLMLFGIDLTKELSTIKMHGI